jgi:hypothetical protein
VLELPSPLAVVCHDAGASNLVFGWLGAGPCERRAFVRGPAEPLWQRRFGAAGVARTLEEALDGAAALLSGTGWASELEHEARRLARARGLRSIAAIDHWVNYRERFERRGEVVLPDEVWVGDELAAAEARRCFPGLPVRVLPNAYMREQVAGIAASPPADRSGDLLYVLEPARSDWGRGRPGEFQALDYFMARRGALRGLPPGGTVHLRPHPSDPPGKYDPWLSGQAGAAALDTSGDLAEAIGRHAWVAGAESFALVVALEAGRRVVCTLPPWAPPCRLPHAGLIHLQHLVDQ